MDAEREKIKKEQLEARIQKLKHQDRETQAQINRQAKKNSGNRKGDEKSHATIKPFRALNGQILIGPWLPGSAPKGGNAHRNRPFIARNLTWSNREASGSNEEEEKKAREHDATSDETGDIDSDGVDDPNNAQRK